MNPFGAFNFGNFIKLFLPGFILFTGIVLAFDAFFLIYIPEIGFLDTVKRAPVIFSFTAIPIILILGIFLNMTFFLGLKDKILQRRLKEEHSDQIHRCDTLLDETVEGYFKNGKFSSNMKEGIREIIKPNFFLLDKIDLHKFNFLLESYWYYYEFQINTMLALVILYPFAAFWLYLRLSLKVGNTPFFIMIAVLTVSIIALSRLCFKCAQKNYAEHKIALSSYWAGILCMNKQLW